MIRDAYIQSEDVLKDRFFDSERASGAIVESDQGIFSEDQKTLFVCAGLQCVGAGVFENGSQPIQYSSLQTCVKMNALDKVGTSAYLTSFRMLTRLRSIRTSRREMLNDELAFLRSFLDLRADDLVFQLSDAYGCQPRDTISETALLALGVSPENIRYKSRHWAAPFGKHVATGPNILVFLKKKETMPERHIWNFEFLEYAETEAGIHTPLEAPLLDSAGNLEGACAVVGGVHSIYRAGSLAQVYLPIVNQNEFRKQDAKILADHIRTIGLLFAEGVSSSPRSHGYVLRKLVRRCLEILVLNDKDLCTLSEAVVALGHLFGPQVSAQVFAEFKKEQSRFMTRLKVGRKVFDDFRQKPGQVDMNVVLLETHGIPKRITERWADEEAGTNKKKQNTNSLRTNQGGRKLERP